MVFGVAEDDVEFAEAVEVDNGPLGEQLSVESVVLSDVLIVRSRVRSFTLPLFSSLQGTETAGADHGSFVSGEFIIPFVAHEATVAWVGFLKQPVYLRVDIRKDLHAVPENVLFGARIGFEDIKKPFPNAWPHGDFPGTRRLSRNVNTAEPHEHSERLVRPVQEERFG